MDLFTGPVGSGQIHDFNPGIRPSGLFWTQPVSEDVLDVDLEDGTATLKVTDLDEEDYHNLHNALLDGPSEAASASAPCRSSGLHRLRRSNSSQTRPMQRSMFRRSSAASATACSSRKTQEATISQHLGASDECGWQTEGSTETLQVQPFLWTERSERVLLETRHATSDGRRNRLTRRV